MPRLRAKKTLNRFFGKGGISDERLYAQEHEEPQAANRTSAWGPALDGSGRADVFGHTSSNIQYEMGERTRGTSVGGIGTMQLVARRTGLIEAIDKGVHVLKRHLPYHESDHVLNIAYNALSGGTCLEDIELRRNDAVYLDALGAQRIPDPTTAGDFCRRFEADDVECLMEATNQVRLGVWRQQPAAFFEEAVLDADGTLAETTGECKQGMDVRRDVGITR